MSSSTAATSKMAGGSGLVEKVNYSALIVEDSSFIRAVKQLLLKKYGFKTTAVENGQQAVDQFTEGNSFDVVFMDMEMPIMNGIQATKELRAMGVQSMIYGVTASESKSKIEAFKAAGLDDCFDKPLTPTKMDIILQRLKN